MMRIRTSRSSFSNNEDLGRHVGNQTFIACRFPVGPLLLRCTESVIGVVVTSKMRAKCR
jgi:hypothetical protein